MKSWRDLINQSYSEKKLGMRLRIRQGMRLRKGREKGPPLSAILIACSLLVPQIAGPFVDSDSNRERTVHAGPAFQIPTPPFPTLIPTDPLPTLPPSVPTPAPFTPTPSPTSQNSATPVQTNSPTPVASPSETPIPQETIFLGLNDEIFLPFLGVQLDIRP